MARGKKKNQEVIEEKVVVNTEETQNVETIKNVVENKPQQEVKEEMQEVEVKEKIQAGEVVGGNKEALKTKTGTLVGCLNFPNNIVFDVPDEDNESNFHKVEFYGNATNLVGKEQGVLPIGAYGLTPNISRADWEWIKANHKDNKFIKLGLLFATEPEKARDEAATRTQLRHGYEPIDMKKIQTSNN